ncbi:MAG TPA: tRNA (adenosine(37)-N6)-threonylcarbamoyltransferase complex ATPase subunit type 1 TsaE [Patescibacteria group bacterium]|nr:tRNA (adenosine(37)-N6)-threonylcarbamoyltransferase complex ATPase subunit type 1 TsaE [Patescibacteria group bacterium]
MITNSFEETQQAGFDFAQTLKGGDLVCLRGDLGSGKTTFVQGLAKGLGIEKKIISPTFIIMRIYDVGIKNPSKSAGRQEARIKSFYHVDLYRIESEKDVEGLGLIDIINDKENIVVIEWPEKIEDRLPKDRKNIFFTYIDENERNIIIE